jgi:precorrin-6A/cobalt-precorrin-6A reductase
MIRLLLLAGSGEARVLAGRLVGVPDLSFISSFVTPPRKPQLGDVRVGGFGGADGFLSYLMDHNVNAVLDGTHPFATRISSRTAQLCAQIEMPHLRLLRPGWLPKAGDRWTMVADARAAAAHIRPGQVVFVASGRDTLAPLAGTGAHIIARQIDPPGHPFPFPGGAFMQATPPFSVEDEVALFTRLGVEILMVKNAGGTASRSKLDAARQLGIQVLMLQRPPVPDCEIVKSVEEAESWAKSLIESV